MTLTEDQAGRWLVGGMLPLWLDAAGLTQEAQVIWDFAGSLYTIDYISPMEYLSSSYYTWARQAAELGLVNWTKSPLSYGQ